ncbi:MAG: DUF4062 domain-containing protein [Phycisphaerales bacterium]|jgi:hypothetical protein|nr:DUF4062 domain-containing protein [Phycisphaerales bacterium]
MAKPRIFVSSTFYDLRHLRDRLKEFIESLGYEPVLFEAGNIPYDPNKPPGDSCYDEVRLCHVLVLIIGGRHGSAASGESVLPTDAPATDRMYQHYKSITEGECQAAVDKKIPVYTLVESAVLQEYETFKKNRNNTTIVYSAVDNVNVFRLLDELQQRPHNKAMSSFDDFEDIADWLRQQWAGLFSEFLRDQQEEAPIKALESQIGRLSDVVDAVKQYTEGIFSKVVENQAGGVIKKSDVESKLTDQILARLVESKAAEILGRPKHLAPRQVLDELRAAGSARDFFTNLGFQSRVEADGRETYEWMPPQGGDYLYYGYPDRTYKKLQRTYLVD